MGTRSQGFRGAQGISDDVTDKGTGRPGRSGKNGVGFPPSPVNQNNQSIESIATVMRNLIDNLMTILPISDMWRQLINTGVNVILGTLLPLLFPLISPLFNPSSSNQQDVC